MSDLFKLDWKDAVKGVVMAVLASVLVFVQQSVASSAPIDWSQIWQIGWAAGLGYILKNFFTDEDGKLMGKL